MNCVMYLPMAIAIHISIFSDMIYSSLTNASQPQSSLKGY